MIDSASMASQADPPPNVAGDQRPCWECSRRRVICDGTRPVCGRCRSGGITCPGYGNARPLRWLAPGRVTSRTRGKVKGRAGKPVQSRSGTARRRTPTRRSDSEESAGMSDRQVACGGWHSEDTESSDDMAVTALGPREPLVVGLYPNAPLESEASNIVQATFYYNDVLYPEYEKDQLFPSPFVRAIPLEVISKATPVYNNILVSVVLRHHIYRLSSNSSNRNSTVELRSRGYYHRGLAINALNEDIRKCDLERAGMLIAGVISFISAELQESATPAWKYHLEALAQVITRAGGIKRMRQAQPSLNVIMTIFILTFVSGSTTSPPSTFNIGRRELDEILEFVEEWWDRLPYPTFPCPGDILLEIVRVNYLRSALSKPGADVTISPEDILHSLRAFSPEAWAAAKPASNEEWLAVATAHHSAAVIYCISSLERHFAPSSRQNLEIQRALYANHLFSSLRKLETPGAMRRCAVWPLVVAGVEAAREGAAARKFVGATFVALAEDLATPLMLEAKSVLEGFWASGKVGWDQCFDKPYAFVL